MFADKKNRNGQINFVLILDIGEMILDVNAQKSEVVYVLRQAIDSLDFK
jgi:3-dehydroquinate synthetase